jgi:hypothetical protein
MSKRPFSLTIIGWLFIVTGGVGLAYHFTEIDQQHPFEGDAVWICFVRFLAVLGGVFMLYGQNWARWLLVAWMVFHIVISGLHSAQQLIVHSLLFGIILFFLFRPRASAFFRRKKGAVDPEADNAG